MSTDTQRRNLWLAVAAVALGQAAVLGYMIWDRVTLLSQGREVVLEVIPVDPRSLFRGDYVILGYDLSRVELPAGTKVPNRGDDYYVIVEKPTEPAVTDAAAPNAVNGNWKVVSAGPEIPKELKPDQVAIKGRVEYVSTPKEPPQTVDVHYGIESFFVPEGTGRELEKLVGDKKLSAVIAAGENGKPAIKGLLSEGKRVYEEPLL
jgi:uncharacterized membrane-anchored protein